MSTASQPGEFFDTLAKVLLRCWILGFVLLLFWFGSVTLAGDLAYQVHGDLFGLTLPELRIIHYCGMLLTKLIVGVLFFIPWVSIRLVLKRHRATR